MPAVSGRVGWNWQVKAQDAAGFLSGLVVLLRQVMAQPSIRKEIPHTVWLIFTCSFKSKSNKFPHGIEFLWFCSSVNVSQYSFVGQSYVLYTFRSSTYSVCTILHCYWWMLLIFPPSGDLRWVIFPNDSCLFIYLLIYFLLLRACCSTLAVSSTCGMGKMFPPVTGSWRCIWLSRCGAEITTTATAVRIPSTPSGATPRFRGVFE